MIVQQRVDRVMVRDMHTGLRASGILLFVLLALGGGAVAACSSSDEESPVRGGDAGKGNGQDSGRSSDDGGVTPDGGDDDDDDAGSDAAPADDAGTDAGSDAGPAGTFSLTSTDFAAGGAIPKVHACTNHGGTNRSPALSWANAPSEAKSFAVVMRDRDVNGSNYHWVIYDIPASRTSLPAGIPQVAAPADPAGAKQTHWSFSSNYSFLGPCPPSGTHNYQFTVYALGVATLPNVAGTTNPATVDQQIQAQKLASASLTGTFAKP